MQEHFQPTTEGGCPLAHQEELQATGGAHHSVRHGGGGGRGCDKPVKGHQGGNWIKLKVWTRLSLYNIPHMFSLLALCPNHLLLDWTPWALLVTYPAPSSHLSIDMTQTFFFLKVMCSYRLCSFHTDYVLSSRKSWVLIWPTQSWSSHSSLRNWFK